MRRNMERSALGASVLLIMTGQAHANSEMLSENDAARFGYQEQMPAYSKLDPKPADRALIGVNNNFGNALADELGYGVQASGVFPELAQPTSSVQAYEYKKKTVEYKATKPVIDIPERIVNSDKENTDIANKDIDDKVYYQAVKQQSIDIVPEVTELNKSNTSEELYVEASVSKIKESAVYQSYETYELYKPASKHKKQHEKQHKKQNDTNKTGKVVVKQTNHKKANKQEYLLLDIPGYDVPSVDVPSAENNLNQSVPIEQQNLNAKNEQKQLVNIPANNATSVDDNNNPSSLNPVLAGNKALEVVNAADLSRTFAREGVGQEATANIQTPDKQTDKVIELPKKISEANVEESAATVVEKQTGTAQKNAVSKEMVEAQRKELANVANANKAVVTTTQNKEAKQAEATPSMVVQKPKTADDALKKTEDDASSEKNLKEVFTASEKRYSLLKKGDWGLNYDARYSYYRDSRIDIATEQNSSRILRFRVEEDAQHSLSNTLGLQYGLRDNLTVSADLPIIAKSDLQKDVSTVGLGDVGLGVRWEPFPLEKGRLPVIVSANVSLPTGDSPYKVDKRRDLSTGKGYYSFGGGVSTRKYVDPVVLFGSASMNYGLPERDLNQSLGNNRFLVGIKPNLSMGAALGFAYSLNYDVSLTMSYQQAFAVGSEFTVRERDETESKIVERTTKSADQTSSTLNMALGIRVSPKTIVNTSVGIGLTEDTPDVSFGVSFPLNFAGFGKKK